jgi:hypothetical protein
VPRSQFRTASFADVRSFMRERPMGAAELCQLGGVPAFPVSRPRRPHSKSFATALGLALLHARAIDPRPSLTHRRNREVRPEAAPSCGRFRHDLGSRSSALNWLLARAGAALRRGPGRSAQVKSAHGEAAPTVPTLSRSATSQPPPTVHLATASDPRHSEGHGAVPAAR